MSTSKRAIFFLLSISAMLICLFSYSAWSLYKVEEKGIKRQFKNEINEQAALIYRELSVNFEVLRSLEIIFNDSTLPSYARFQFEAQRILSRYSDVTALEWVPRRKLAQMVDLPVSNPATSKRSAQKNNELIERIATGSNDVANIHDVGHDYFSVYFTEPLYGSDAEIDRHYRDYQQRLQALSVSIKTGQPQITGMIEFDSKTESHNGFFAFLPIYSGISEIVEQRHVNFVGFVLAIYQVDSIISSAMTMTDMAGINIQLFDITHHSADHAGSLPAIFSLSDSMINKADAGFEYDKALPSIWGRAWRLSAYATDHYLDSKRSKTPYLVLMMGLFFAAFLAFYIKFNMQRTQVITRIVNEKTNALSKANQRLQQLSRSDGLTQLANRRTMDEVLNREWSRAIRNQSVLSFILIDIDFFKQYNDNYGHVMGDTCLQKVAQALQTVPRRSSDLIARYGGEEFAIILAETEHAETVAENCRQQIEALNIEHEFSETSEVLTISIGYCSAVPAQGIAPSSFIHAADRALYKAKDAGRNCVYSATTNVSLCKAVADMT